LSNVFSRNGKTSISERQDKYGDGSTIFVKCMMKIHFLAGITNIEKDPFLNLHL